MGFEYRNQLPTPDEIKQEYPLPQHLMNKKQEKDQDILNILTGKSEKLLMIIGPCSADREDAVLDYAHRLAKVQEDLKDKFLFIPRVYTNKPRTTGEGYKGMVHQPDPQKKPDLYEGIIATRKMHMNIFCETGLPTADEMLYPENMEYLSDLISYIAVGARSVENQQHRLTASGCNIPVGMKNPTSGNLSVMLNSIVAAQQEHNFIYRNWEVKTDGNPLTHGILRGCVNKQGQHLPNYHYEDLILLYDLYQKRDLVNPACIVDTNHSNSNKQYQQQIRIAKEVLHSRRHSKEIQTLVKGLMIESYIEPGSQCVTQHTYGKSITDSCLGWECTKRLLYDLADSII